MTRATVTRSSVLVALAMILLPMLGLPSAQAADQAPADKLFEVCLVNNGTTSVLPGGRVRCCSGNYCVTCGQTPGSCRTHTTSTPPSRIDPGSGSGLDGGTYSSQPPAVLQFGN